MADYLQAILFMVIYVTAVGIISPERLLTFTIRVSHGKIVTSKCSHYLPIFICVGEFMRPVNIIFQTVLL